MITQKLMQGENEIRIESAESLDDAKKNSFREGEYSRYFVNGKPVATYMLLMKYMIDETKKNGKSFIPDSGKLIEMRRQMIETQNKEIRTKLVEMRKQFGNNISDYTLKMMDEMSRKIDGAGIRIVE